MITPKNYMWKTTKDTLDVIFHVAVMIINVVIGAGVVAFILNWLKFWSLIPMCLFALYYYIRQEARIAYEADKMMVQERLTAKRGSIERQYQLGSIFRAMELEDKMEYLKTLQSDFDEIYAEYVENYGEDNFAKKERECAEYASRYLDELIKNKIPKHSQEKAEAIEAKVMARVRKEAEIAARACADKPEANTGKVEEDKNV